MDATLDRLQWIMDFADEILARIDIAGGRPEAEALAASEWPIYRDLDAATAADHWMAELGIPIALERRVVVGPSDLAA